MENVLKEIYESLDIHPGQSMSFLVTLHGMVKDYHIVASARFTKKHLLAQAVLHYVGSTTPPAYSLPLGPSYHIHWSMKQARTLRPNPQGSFHYGGKQITRTLILANSAGKINGKKHYGVNGVSYVNPDTPLKLADYYNIPNVFDLNTTPSFSLNKPHWGFHKF
ncbi:hypothetical protein RND81_11G221200 [Saponaria officinalis]|uniref:Plastocyanin-like domain-containing protein n=1 Tax=Saponaria officinalis TaxID=3572 RepID=A0AAW1HRI7_SAPOF